MKSISKKIPKLRLHISFMTILMGIVMFAIGAGFTFVAYIIAVVLHELAHSVVAERRGYVLNDIKIMPYGASIGGDTRELKPYDEIVIALAGPVFSLLLAVVFVALWWIVPTTYFFSLTFVHANIFLFLFNIVPVYPLDGGRVALALLSLKMPREKAVKYMTKFGWVFAIVFAILFLISFFFVVNFSFGLAAAFIVVSTLLPDKANTYHRIYSQAYRTRQLRKGLPVKELMVSANCTLIEITRTISGNYYHRLIVCDDKMVKVAIVEQKRFEELLLMHCPTTPIGSVIAS